MKKSKVKINYPIYKIVADGALSDPHRGEGRIYPALAIDVRDNLEVRGLFKLHQETPPGDTKLIWGRPNTLFKAKTVILSFEFTKPMHVVFGVEFDVKRQFSLADGVIQQRGVILVAGKPGDKFSELIHESIIVEVPNLGFDQEWNKILNETLHDKYRKMGASKKDATKYAKEHIKNMREFWNIRRD